MKALQYKEYFTHIDSEQILKSLEDIHVIGLINDERETNLCRKQGIYLSCAGLPMINTDETWK
jgi:hypothetical protein